MEELATDQKELVSLLERPLKLQPGHLWVLSAIIVVTWVFYIVRHPLLANPVYVFKKLQTKTYPDDVIIIITGFFPLLFNTCWILLLSLALISTCYIKRIQKLLEILQAMQKSSNDETL